MLLHGSPSESDDQSILLPRSSAFTGCASQSASPSSCLSWRTDQSTALYLVTYSRVSPCHRQTSRRRLRSSASHRLEVPPVRLRLSTVGERAFPVADANMWNDLLFQITSAQSLAVFRRRLKTFLFSRSYPDNDILLILLTDLLLFSGIPCKPCNNWHFWTFQSTDQSHGTVCHRH